MLQCVIGVDGGAANSCGDVMLGQILSTKKEIFSIVGSLLLMGSRH